MINLLSIAYVIGFTTDLIERGASILEVKELMGHSNIRSTMEYIHIAKKELSVENPLDEFMKGEK
ncbi:MAG: tyrosine-type recombinase/integrase [Clostridia bacterium]